MICTKQWRWLMTVSSYLTSPHIVSGAQRFFNLTLRMQTERFYSALWSLKLMWSVKIHIFSNYNNSLSKLVINIFLVFSQSKRLGDFTQPNFPTSPGACQVITEEKIFPIRMWGLCLVRVVHLEIFLTLTSWLCLTEEKINQELWEILCDCDVMLVCWHVSHSVM